MTTKKSNYASKRAEALRAFAFQTLTDPASTPEDVASAKADLAARDVDALAAELRAGLLTDPRAMSLACKILDVFQEHEGQIEVPADLRYGAKPPGV